MRAQLRAVRAEFVKLLTLPGVLIGAAVAIAGPVLLAVLNATGVRDALDSGQLDTVGYTSPLEAGLSAVPLGTVGAVVIGVLAVSSEYATTNPDIAGSRQITATLTAMPHRIRLLIGKAVGVVLVVVATALVSVGASLLIAQGIIGDRAPAEEPEAMVARGVGAGLYWVLMALIALAITALVRSGTIPMIVLIANSSLVSVSILLANLTDLAYYLPDLAGISMFSSGASWSMASDALDPVSGGLVMAAWTLGLLVVAAVVFRRRDA